MSRSILKRDLIADSHPASAVSEAYRSLRTNIAFSSREEAVKTIAFTSALPGEGKSTIAANIAVAYAQTKRRVVVIDANLRKPAQHEIFGLSNVHGLSTVLTKHGELDDVLQRTGVGNLQVITAGPLPANPSELLESIPMTELLAAAKERFDIVILDTPSIDSVSDGLVVASKSDGVVLVMKAGKVKNEIALKAKASLEYGNANLIGAVLNNVNR
ncbi:CpsD/CapB family tyrosine-protein kinase [Paenibacillus glycinis]|uniref:non-specific protein-tyrosine kinase n=1 Tax=Paenibacillus glycinis TaxID=2697035 RepID=A0ABW9XUH9_9BACL|nr:CpsD/CapB family tyrosine-protein kinase [Paenibacillus glycinis]NBD26332.1 polysaccharide biosynthesis tyrosine autokinase [Paenibacillus glycinis]